MYLLNPMIIVTFSEEAQAVYDELKNKPAAFKKEKSILRAIDQKVELIKIDKHYGTPVAKQLIPLEYKENCKAVNLFRVELPCYWRMLYTLTKEDSTVEIIALIVDVVNHKEYNKKSKYRKN